MKKTMIVFAALLMFCLSVSMVPVQAFEAEGPQMILPYDACDHNCVEINATKIPITEDYAYYQAYAGTAVTITPKTGYKIKTIELLMGEAEPVDHTLAPDGSSCTFIMPDSSVDLFVFVERIGGGGVEHSVTVLTAGGGNPQADKTRAVAGETITISLNPLEGRVLDYMQLAYYDEYNNEKYENCYGTSFPMPDSNVTVTVYYRFGNNPPADPEYDIVVNPCEGGRLTADRTKAKAGETVTITVEANNGFERDTLSVTNTTTNASVDVVNNTFEMPASSVVVQATFKQAAPRFEVSFNSNGGSTNPASTTVNNRNQLNVLPEITREGYTLVGWFTKPDGGDQVTTNTVFTQDTIVYAHWVKAEHTTDPDKNAFHADIDLDDLDILKLLLTDDELAGDKNIKVYLTVEEQPETTVPETAKTGITAQAGEDRIAAYLDINLYKQIDNQTPERISNPGVSVPIVMKLPQNLIPSNAARVYVIYYHGQETKTIDNVVYQPSTGKLQFNAKEFSYYALAYEPGSTQPQPPAPNGPASAPKTGDESNLALWLCMMAVSLIGVNALTRESKKHH